MTKQRGPKPPDQDQQRKAKAGQGRNENRAGAGPSLRQAMAAGRVRPHAAAREALGQPSGERRAQGSLGLELEGRERRGGAVTARG